MIDWDKEWLSEPGDNELVYVTKKKKGEDTRMMYAQKIGFYPDGMPLMAAPLDEVDTMLLRPKSFATFMAAMLWVDGLRARGLRTPKLVLPNLPGARQDRINPEGDYLFTAKSVAQIINARRFPTVVVIDPHSEVMPALIDHCEVVPASLRRQKVYAGVISPDAGASKRAGLIAKENGVPLYHGWKNRDVKTGNLTGFGLQPIPPGHYLVADDLCDGGGTFIGLAEVIAAQGATADLYVTHGLFTKGPKVVTDVFKMVITTDSSISDKTGVAVLPRAESILKEL